MAAKQEAKNPAFALNSNSAILQATGRLSAYLTSVCGRNSAVECQLPKLDVEGSSPFARFFVRCPAQADEKGILIFEKEA